MPIAPLRMTDALANEESGNNSDDASVSDVSVATVENAGATATGHETDARSKKRPESKTSPEGIKRDDGSSARAGGSKSRPVREVRRLAIEERRWVFQFR